MATNPRKIFSIPEQAGTRVVVGVDEQWTVQAAAMHSRAAWTPFEGKTVSGRVQQVYLRNQLVYDGEKVLAPIGFGRNLKG
jgi:dihydroorotase-like cyclic amidohydrolase